MKGSNGTLPLAPSHKWKGGLALLFALALPAGAANGLKRELCGVRLGLGEQALTEKVKAREVSAEYPGSLGQDDKMFSLPLVAKQRLQTRCLARTHEGKVAFIEATWAPEYAKLYAWDDFLAPETREYGQPAARSVPYGDWMRESRVWQDTRTVMTISRSSRDAVFYQVSIEDAPAGQ